MNVRTKWIIFSAGALFFALTTLVQRWLQPRGARVEESLPTAEAPDARDAHAELTPLAG